MVTHRFSLCSVIKTYVPNEFLVQWGDGFLAFVVMALVGVPMYVCATASTPIAAGLLFSGVSPGAALVFMLVGPATNIATVALVKKELGSRALTAYLTSVVGVGFAFGYLTNYLSRRSGTWTFWPKHEHAHEHGQYTAIGLCIKRALGGSDDLRVLAGKVRTEHICRARSKSRRDYNRGA